SLYIVVAAAGAVLVTYGIVEQEVVDSILPMVAGVLAVAGGGVAAANTDTKKINPVMDEQEEPVEPASSVPDVTPSVSGLPVWDHRPQSLTRGTREGTVWVASLPVRALGGVVLGRVWVRCAGPSGSVSGRSGVLCVGCPTING